MSVQLADGKLDCTMSDLGSLDKLPQNVTNAAGSITSVNLSFCCLDDESLSSGAGLGQFNAVETLVLDNNELTSLKNFPEFKHLHTLWLNKNSIESIDETLTILQRCAPRLTYLSLVMNPCAPSELTGASEAEYNRYRVLVKYRLPNLQLLDAAPFTAKEAETAKERGKFYMTATAKQEGVPGSPTSPKEKKAEGGETDGPEKKDSPDEKKKAAVAADDSDDDDLFAEMDAERGKTNEQGAVYTQQTHIYKGTASEGNKFIGDKKL